MSVLLANIYKVTLVWTYCWVKADDLSCEVASCNEVVVVVKQIYSVLQCEELVAFVHAAEGEIAGQF